MGNITVLTFHTVMDHKKDRPWAFLSTSVSAFEKTLKYLKTHNYQTITLRELYDWKKGGKDDGVKRVLIHFDDGFLDNFTIAYPMLKKYGFKASVFVSPEFVDPRPIIREPQYENIIAGRHVDESNVWGYMSWDELRKVDREGIIDVQAHAMTHTWYPCESKFVDWHHPEDSYYWLAWNAESQNKPYWLTEYKDTAVPFGYPIFKYSKAMSEKRFFPRQAVIDFSIQFYKDHEDECTGEKKNEMIGQFRQKLKELFKDGLGSFETDLEFEKRIRIELIDSKKIIEEQLDKKIEFLVWPGGAVSDTAYQIAEEAGYLAWSRKGKPYNELKDDLKEIYRLGGWSGIKFRNCPIDVIEYFFLKMQLHRAKGSKSIINRVYALIGVIHRKRHIQKCRKNGENWK